MQKRETQTETFIAQSVEKTKEQKRAHLVKRFDDPGFKEDLRRLKGSIATGHTIVEARHRLGFASDTYWRDLIYALSVQVMSPENIALEWVVRQQSRYQQAMELYSLSREKQSLEMMSRAVLLLAQIDKQDIELKKALGLVKPIQVGEDGGLGISQEDVDFARQRFDSLVEERILNKLAVRRTAQQPVPIDVLDGPEAERPSDVVDTSAVAQERT